MKKILLILIVIILNCQNVFAQDEKSPLSGQVDFDWVQIEQGARNSLIENYSKLVLDPSLSLPFQKDEITPLTKDPDFLQNVVDVKNGKIEDDKRFLAGFYIGKLLVAYGIIEKSNPRNAYYYDVMGTLRFVDVMSKDYGDFPYITYQYNPKGKLIARIYELAKDDQFMYGPNKGGSEFLGRWYQNKLYGKNGRVKMRRSFF